MAEHLLDCAFLGLESTPAGAPGRACIVPGQEPAFYECCDSGQLTLNMLRTFETNQFPSISVAGGGPVGSFVTANACGLPWSVVEYLLTIVRCVPGIQDSGGGRVRYPSCESLSDSARKTFKDQEVIRRSLKCCLSELDKRVNAWAMGEAFSIGPEGNCAGTGIRVFVGFMNCRPCDDGGG